MMSRVGLLLISTGKYDRFIEPLIHSIDKYFFKGEDVDIYLFNDKYHGHYYSKRINITQIAIPHLPFPYPTLYRYKWFDENAEKLKSDYLFYLDIDMLLVSDVGEEILGDIVCVQHPGFYNGGWGSKECSKQSLAYLLPKYWEGYKAGGFQGGKTENYLAACNVLATGIEDDERRGVMAEWHDESHWNWFLKAMCMEKSIKILSPSYCFPEAGWAKDMPFEKKIMALEKNHKQLRS